MAKARSAPGGPRPQRQTLVTPGPVRAGLRGYFRGVWEELKKVVWPTRDELVRMTGIVMATVVLFALLIGGADYVLSLAVRQVVTSSASQTTPSPAAVPSAPATGAPATPLP